MTKLNRLNTVKSKMRIYSLIIIFVMTILSMYSLSINKRYKGQIENMFEKHIYLSKIKGIMVELDEDLLGYLTSKSSTRLNEYLSNIEVLKELVPVNNSYENIYNMNDLMMKNITNLIDEYMIQANMSINYKRQRNVAKYYQYYKEDVKIMNFIFQYIDKLNDKQLTQNSNSYIDLVYQIRLLQLISYVMVIALIVISIVIVHFISSIMVKPISNLTYVAEEISKGNFDIEDIIVESKDEFSVLAKVFNNMKNSISQYIEELTLKAETETKLKDEQLENIKMKHLLDNAKLYALQSQINPHFLFNTINAAVHMSILERATKTGDFLESMSRLFRYNIKKMDSNCILKEEIENIEDYYDLLKVRFGNRIQFKFNIEKETLYMKVPPLILQPLVENAYIHGLSGLEEGGIISINSIKTMEKSYVIVEDTGKGMNADRIDKILNKNREDDEYEKFGIGIRNVRDRLELFYQKEDIFKIESSEGNGVKIIIEIPNNVG